MRKLLIGLITLLVILLIIIFVSYPLMVARPVKYTLRIHRIDGTSDIVTYTTKRGSVYRLRQPEWNEGRYGGGGWISVSEDRTICRFNILKTDTLK